MGEADTNVVPDEQGWKRLKEAFSTISVWSEEANPRPLEVQEQLDNALGLAICFGHHPVEKGELSSIMKNVGEKTVADLEGKAEMGASFGFQVKTPYIV